MPESTETSRSWSFKLEGLLPAIAIVSVCVGIAYITSLVSERYEQYTKKK